MLGHVRDTGINDAGFECTAREFYPRRDKVDEGIRILERRSFDGGTKIDQTCDQLVCARQQLAAGQCVEHALQFCATIDAHLVGSLWPSPGFIVGDSHRDSRSTKVEPVNGSADTDLSAG